MNNENQNLVTSNNQVEQTTTIPEWAQKLGDSLGVNAYDVLVKQANTANSVSQEDKQDIVAGLIRLGEVSQGVFSENEALFMYLVGIKNIMDASAELTQLKQMLSFFTSFGGDSGEIQDAEFTEQP